MRQFVTSNDGTQIACEKTGRGDVVMIVLGALNSRKSGTELARLLAPRFTVISYDRRGRGDSTNTSPYSPRREVEDIAAIVGAVEGPVYLYGHSSGGALAIQAAIKLRKRVRKLAVYEVPWVLDAKARKAAKEYYGALRKLLASGRNSDAVALFVRRVGVSEKQVGAMRRLPMWKGLERLAPTLAYESEILGEGQALPVELLSRVRTPTLVMHGSAGTASMRDATRAISGAIPEAKLRTLEGETHGVRPESLAPVLEEFFS